MLLTEMKDRIQKYITDKRYNVITIVLALIYSVCTVLGRNIDTLDDGCYTDIRTYIRIVIFCIIYKVFIDVLVLIYESLRDYKSCASYQLSDRTFFMVAWLIFLLGWLPTYIACYPGLAIYDGPGQVSSWSRHHPFIHTAFLHLCMAIDRSFSNLSWVGVYSATQYLLFSLAFAYIIYRLKKLNVNSLYVAMLMVVTVIFPLNSLMAITTTKDVMFSVIFAIWVIEIICIATGENEYWCERTNTIRFIAFSLLMCAFRNNGIYVLVATGLIVFCLLKSGKKRWIITTMSVALVFGILNGPVLTMAGIPKGNAREAMSVIIQPLARTYNCVDDEMSQEDRASIEKLFGDAAPWYIGHISDPPKSQFDTEEFTANKAKYMRLFVREGIEYPTVYLDALSSLTYGNWYPFETLPDDTCFRVYFEFPEKTAEEYGSRMKKYYRYLQNFSRYSCFNAIYPLRIILSNGFAFWVLLAEMAYGIYKANRKMVVATIPSLMLWGTIMLGPVALFRYTYPLMIVNVVICGLIFSEFFAKKDKDSI